MRTGFKDKKNVPLDSLILDEHNPRLGYAPDQAACLSKMISFGATFFAIAKDIAENGLTIEPIVVLKQRNKLIVKDGNRRISALKLLNRPYLCAEKSVRCACTTCICLNIRAIDIVRAKEMGYPGT